MKRILIDVDTQFDFVDSGGSLYVEADASVREAIAACLEQAAAEGRPSWVGGLACLGRLEFAETEAPSSPLRQGQCGGGYESAQSYRCVRASFPCRW